MALAHARVGPVEVAWDDAAFALILLAGTGGGPVQALTLRNRGGERLRVTFSLGGLPGWRLFLRSPLVAKSPRLETVQMPRGADLCLEFYARPPGGTAPGHHAGAIRVGVDSAHLVIPVLYEIARLPAAAQDAPAAEMRHEPGAHATRGPIERVDRDGTY